MYKHSTLIHNRKAAEVVLPIVFDINKPSSILDLGTGIGTWLFVAKQLGVKEVLGVDGAYVDVSLRRSCLADDEFLAHDLKSPLELNRKFDLCICLEVAEHLEQAFEDILIKSIITHSDSILFSAAIPGQGGQGHVNENWLSYWINKFEKFGFFVYDPIRCKVWNDLNVDFWYRQNIVFFSKHDLFLAKPVIVDFVFPGFFEREVRKNVILEGRLQDVLEGKKGVLFYLKRVFISIIKFGGRKI